MTRNFYRDRIKSVDFNGILASYINILDILGAIATLIYNETMFPENNINLTQQNLIGATMIGNNRPLYY